MGASPLDRQLNGAVRQGAGAPGSRGKGSELMQRDPRVRVHLGEKQASHLAAYGQRAAHCVFGGMTGSFARRPTNRQVNAPLLVDVIRNTDGLEDLGPPAQQQRAVLGKQTERVSESPAAVRVYGSPWIAARKSPSAWRGRCRAGGQGPAIVMCAGTPRALDQSPDRRNGPTSSSASGTGIKIDWN